MVQLHLLIHRVSYFRCLYNENKQYSRAPRHNIGNRICNNKISIRNVCLN